MRTLNKSAVFFASLVAFLFVMLPFCEAEVIAVNSGMQNIQIYDANRLAKNQAAIVKSALQAEAPAPVPVVQSVSAAKIKASPAKVVPPVSRMAALDAMSFVQAPLDPITKENLKEKGLPVSPPPSPVPVMLAVPIPPAVVPEPAPSVAGPSPETPKEAPASAAKSAVMSALNYEQSVFDTPASLDNVDEANQCIMPGIPGAEMSGAGLDEYGGDSAMGSADAGIAGGSFRPGRGGGGGGLGGVELIGSGAVSRRPDIPGKGGGGGGEDSNDGAASYSSAEARLGYLQTITDWAYEAYEQGSSMATMLGEFAGSQDAKDTFGKGLDSLGSPDKWKNIQGAMDGAFNGLADTGVLYAETLGTYKKITKAYDDKSGNGAGTQEYEYNGVLNACNHGSDCRSAEKYYGYMAEASSNVKSLEIQLQNPNLKPEEKQKLQAELNKAEQKSSATKGFDQGVINEYSGLKKELDDYSSKIKIDEKGKEPTTVGALMKENSNIVDKYGSFGSMNRKIGQLTEQIAKEPDKNKKAELEKEKAEVRADMDKHNENEAKIGKATESDKNFQKLKGNADDFLKKHPSQVGGISVEGQAKSQSWLDDKAKGLGLSDPKDALTYMAWEKFDADIDNMIGSSGTSYGGFEKDEPATGLHKSLDDLKKTYEASKDFMSPERQKETEKHIAEYEGRMKDLDKSKEDRKKHREDSAKDHDLDDKEKEDHLEKQKKDTEEGLDLAGDIAKDFKEILKDVIDNFGGDFSAWWGQMNKSPSEGGIGEVPGGNCKKDPPTVCSQACDAGIYGKAEARGADAASKAAKGAAESVQKAGQAAAGAAQGLAGWFTGGVSLITGFVQTGPGGVPMGGSAPMPGPGGEPAAGDGSGDSGSSGGDAGSGGAGPPVSGGGSGMEECIGRAKCPSFPEPPGGEGGGGGDRRKPADLQEIAKKAGNTPRPAAPDEKVQLTGIDKSPATEAPTEEKPTETAEPKAAVSTKEVEVSDPIISNWIEWIKAYRLNARMSGPELDKLTQLILVKGNKLAGYQAKKAQFQDKLNDPNAREEAVASGKFDGPNGNKQSLLGGQKSSGSKSSGPSQPGRSSSPQGGSSPSMPTVSGGAGISRGISGMSSPTGGAIIDVTGAGVVGGVIEWGAGKVKDVAKAVGDTATGIVLETVSAAGTVVGGVAESVGGLATYDQQESEKASRARAESIYNFNEVVKDAMDQLDKMNADQIKDTKEEIARSGFAGGANPLNKAIEDSLLNAGGLLPAADAFRSLNEAEEWLNARTGEIRALYDGLIDERETQLSDARKEYEDKKAACGGGAEITAGIGGMSSPAEDCAGNALDDWAEKNDKIHATFDPAIAEADKLVRESQETDLTKIAGSETTMSSAAGLKAISEFRDTIEEKVVTDSVKKFNKETVEARGEYFEVLNENERKGWKSIDLLTEFWFEGQDVSVKQESLKISENLKKGASIFNDLRKELVKKGMNTDELVKIEGYFRQASLKGKGIDGKDTERVQSFVDDINKKLGKTGADKISLNDDELSALGTYWDVSGRSLAKQVDGSYTPADGAKGLYKIGMMKKEVGDYVGALKEFGQAAALGEGSKIGSKANSELKATQKKLSTQMWTRMGASIVLDPLNYLTFGSAVLGKAAQGVKKVAQVVEGLERVDKIIKGIAKASKVIGATLGTVGKGVKEIPVLGKIAKGGEKVAVGIGKGLDRGADLAKGIVRGATGRAADDAGSMSAKIANDLKGVAADSAEGKRLAGNLEKAKDLENTLNQVNRETKILTQYRSVTTTVGKKEVKDIGAKINRVVKDTMESSKSLSTEQKLAAVEKATEGLRSQFKTAQNARDLINKKPEGGFITNLLFGDSSAKNSLKTSRLELQTELRKFGNLANSGADTGEAANRIKIASNRIEDSLKVLDAGNYLRWDNSLVRNTKSSVNNLVDDATNAVLRVDASDIKNARNSVRQTENVLGRAIYSNKNDDVARAWETLESSKSRLKLAQQTNKADNIVDATKEAVRTPVSERPLPAAKAPKNSADNLKNTLNNAPPEKFAEQARAVEDKARDLERNLDISRNRMAQATDDFKAGKIDMDEYKAAGLNHAEADDAARNAKTQATKLKEMAERRAAGAPVVPERAVPRPVVERPTPHAGPAEVPAARMTPEQAKVKLFDDVGIKEEKFTQYRVRAEDGSYKQVTNAELQAKYGSDWESKVSELSKGDAPQIKAYEQVRYKKGNVWIKEDEAMSKVVNKIRTQQLDDLGKTNQRMVDLQASKSQYYEAIQDGDISEAKGMEEINKLDARISELKGQFDKTAKGLASEDVDKLYEGQESYLTYLRNKIKGASETERKILNEDYRKISAQQDALFNLQAKTRVSVDAAQKPLVPGKVAQSEMDVVKAIYESTGNAVDKGVAEDIGRALGGTLSEKDASLLGKKLAAAVKELCSCETTIEGIRNKIATKIREAMNSDPEIQTILKNNKIRPSEGMITGLAGEVMRSKTKQFGMGEEMLKEILQDGHVSASERDLFFNAKFFTENAPDSFATEANELKGVMERSRQAGEAVPPKVEAPKVVIETPTPIKIPEAAPSIKATKPITPVQRAVIDQNEGTLKNIARYENDIVGNEDEIVYQIIDSNTLERLAKENKKYGLRSGDTKRSGFDGWVDTFSEALPENLKGQNIRRADTYVYGNPSEFVSYEILDQIGLAGKDYAVTKIKIDPAKAIVVDNKAADRMARTYEIAGSSAEFKQTANEYWATALSYSDFKKYYTYDKEGSYVLKSGAPAYLKKDIVPEVLVFEPAPLEKVGLATRPKKWDNLVSKTGASSASEALAIKSSAAIPITPSPVDNAINKVIPGLVEQTMASLPSRQPPPMNSPAKVLAQTAESASSQSVSIQDMIAEVRRRFGQTA